MIEIELTRVEWLYAATRGIERQIDGALRKRHPGHGSPDKRTNDGWFWNVNGASGEACVAKWLGVPWNGSFGNLKASDVAFLEVRTTPGHDYPLRLHDDDKDGCVYVLVTGRGPTWRIHGYIVGARGKRQEWFHDRPPPSEKPTGRPAYWVPQGSLSHDLALLKGRVLAHLARQQANGQRRDRDQERQD
jgi:hypothetical protein